MQLMANLIVKIMVKRLELMLYLILKMNFSTTKPYGQRQEIYLGDATLFMIFFFLMLSIWEYHF